MHLDDGFVFTDLVVAVLEVKGEGILHTILDECLAKWAFDEIIDTLGLMAISWVISLDAISVPLTLNTHLAPGVRRL